MSLKIGIDVGGTFTDFLVTRTGVEPKIYKVLSTPADPSIGVLDGLRTIATSMDISIRELARTTETIVHGTTVTTNAVLTLTGAKTGLLTTRGVRDALEMRRGIREEQYNNRFVNVPPLVPRYLRAPVAGRLDCRGDQLARMDREDVARAIDLFKKENVQAVAICFMNSFANPEHENQAAKIVRRALPEAYLTVSSELLPSIRFYDRVSSTVLNSYVGPKLSSYLGHLTDRLEEIEFAGVLMIMQSNGGVMAPDVAHRAPALTLLSGPAAAPSAGYEYSHLHGHDSFITIDMGGTSFDAALVRDGTPTVVTDGEINRYRIALPMLDIVTIGAGGGSVGWIDEGGLLRMGPQSAGADPGPACYDKGGSLPTSTDADLVLGYLDPAFFAGGQIPLNRDAAIAAIDEHIATPLGMTVEQAAAGMYRVINTNMAQGVREISVKRGVDPREFPIVAAGGAGPLHACMICHELEIPLLIVPRESSIFCAAGMLMSDLRHDFVQSFVSPLDKIDWIALLAVIDRMRDDGDTLLSSERIPNPRRQYVITLDCRYAKQYHEVSFVVAEDLVRRHDATRIAQAFHEQHLLVYGYSLEDQNTPVELINVRLRAVGTTDKPRYPEEERAGADATHAIKSERPIYVPERDAMATAQVYDGHKTRHGNSISGPAVIEQVNTTLLLTDSYDCVCDKFGSFVVHRKGARCPTVTTLRKVAP